MRGLWLQIRVGKLISLFVVVVVAHVDVDVVLLVLGLLPAVVGHTLIMIPQVNLISCSPLGASLHVISLRIVLLIVPLEKLVLLQGLCILFG